MQHKDASEFSSVADAIDWLRGTCNDLLDIPAEWLAEIDAEIFLCEACGWWCEQSENVGADGQVCVDCCDENEG